MHYIPLKFTKMYLFIIRKTQHGIAGNFMKRTSAFSDWKKKDGKNTRQLYEKNIANFCQNKNVEKNANRSRIFWFQTRKKPVN